MRELKNKKARILKLRNSHARNHSRTNTQLDFQRLSTVHSKYNVRARNMQKNKEKF